MGKKYIIELPENTHWVQWILESTKDQYQVCRLDFKRVEDLTPYTEPDLEQVKCEAYEEGRNSLLIEVQKAGKNKIKLEEDEYYQRGLSDAWEAARKILEYDTTTLREIFGEGIMRMDWFMKFTASEAIEKLKAYEQEKEEFHVGDEFENGSLKRFVILKMDGAEIDRYIDEEGKTYCMTHKYKVMRKTGRHFPEVAAVLEKMRESE